MIHGQTTHKSPPRGRSKIRSISPSPLVDYIPDHSQIYDVINLFMQKVIFIEIKMNKMKKTIFFPKKGIKLKIKIRNEERKKVMTFSWYCHVIF